jgi:2-iminoacetate synthase ThiH
MPCAIDRQGSHHDCRQHELTPRAFAWAWLYKVQLKARVTLQEVIIQNFRAKKGTAMAMAPEPPLEELLWTVAMARIILGPAANIQVPKARHTPIPAHGMPHC